MCNYRKIIRYTFTKSNLKMTTRNTENLSGYSLSLVTYLKSLQRRRDYQKRVKPLGSARLRGCGEQSIETITMLFCNKLKYPESFFLLRGSHESNTLINIHYGFYKECKRRYMTDRLFQYMQVGLFC